MNENMTTHMVSSKEENYTKAAVTRLATFVASNNNNNNNKQLDCRS